MSALRSTPPRVRRLLELSRSDRPAAREALAELSIEEQVAVVCEAPVAERGRLLGLAAEPEKLVPALPEAELCFTAKAVGLHDAGWILEHATPEQLVACVDLDAWHGFAPDVATLGDWLRALADAGEETLARATNHLDTELVVLHLRSRIDAVLKPNDDSWAPPAGARTIDGQFYFRARKAKDDLAEIEMLLRTLFQSDYWAYFRLLQAVRWELDSETEEFALRWRTGRLADLGFPEWEESMAVYARLRPEELTWLPAGDAKAESPDPWALPIWLPPLPEAAEDTPLLFRAMAGLAEAEREGARRALLKLANSVAVSERLPRGDAETVQTALARAAELSSLGLDFLAREHAVSPIDVLRRVPIARLFRVGVNLAGEPPPGSERVSEEPPDDPANLEDPLDA